MSKITLGIENLEQNFKKFDYIEGNVALLSHAASVNQKFIHTAEILKNRYGSRFVALFGPQHGFVCDVQDNMIESQDFIHPLYNIPVFSLYGETRIPTDKMLQNIDIIFIDLIDVGTRVYTYISTLFLLMEKCLDQNIKLIILDRPNPVGGLIVEGNVLDKKYRSFVGLSEMPMRHGMTMGEVAVFYKNKYFHKSQLEVIPMKNWKRDYFFKDCDLNWINPSPNLSTPESAITFCGSVLFEGTNISEGRGTTRALELTGFPNVDPYKFIQFFNKKWSNNSLVETSFILRAIHFLPTFQKHQDQVCGGVFIHSIDNQHFYSWKLGQMLLQTWIHYLGDDFSWNKDPYEYKFEGFPIDYINGKKELRDWCHNKGDLKDLESLEKNHLMDIFLAERKEALIY